MATLLPSTCADIWQFTSHCRPTCRAIFVTKTKTRIITLRSTSTKTRIMTICETKTI